MIILSYNIKISLILIILIDLVEMSKDDPDLIHYLDMGAHTYDDFNPNRTDGGKLLICLKLRSVSSPE